MRAEVCAAIDISLFIDKMLDTAGRVFGVDLRDSLRYAAAAVSATQYNGYLVVHSYVPLVVAACGAYLRKYGKRLSIVPCVSQYLI